MDIEFDTITNLPYLLAYYDDRSHMTGIKKKKSEDQKRISAYEILYHKSSIDASINSWYKENSIKYVNCAECGRPISLNQSKEKRDVHGLFCDYCARSLNARYSYEFLSKFYDAEQVSLGNVTENNKVKQEVIKMAIKSTIIGFVLESEGEYKIYNPGTNQLTIISAENFESLCLGEFPYRKVRANTLANNEIVETSDGKIYYVSDATKNELFDFETGKIERSAVKTNLMVNINCYTKYVPVLKKYCTFADVAAGNVDQRVAKMLEVISNDIQSGKEVTENNVVAKLVRFLMDPDYADLLDTETLNDMVMADPQAFAVMTNMINMEMAKSIMAQGGAIPLSFSSQEMGSTESIPVSFSSQEMGSTESIPDESVRKDGESDIEYEQRLNQLMEESAASSNYEMAAKYQKVLTDLQK